MVRDIYNEIRWAWQRVFRGYDDRIKWGFSSYFEIAIKPLEEFCVEELSEMEQMSLNPERREVFTTTLSLIQEHRMAGGKDYFEYPNAESRLWEYVGKNISWYWD